MKKTIFGLLTIALLNSCQQNHTPEIKKASPKIEAPKVEQPKVDTSSVLMNMSIKRLELMMEVKEAEARASEAKAAYYLNGEESDYRKAKKAAREYNTAFSRYDSLDKAMRKLYAIYNKKELPQPSKLY
jgi:hypothetical protein